jgi:endonuclease III
MVEKVPTWIVDAAQRVIREYQGECANVWNDRPTAAALRRRLDEFEGIGQKKSAMAVEILERHFGVPLSELEGSDVAYDVHVRRVFLRAGLTERDDPAALVEAARKLNPSRPGALDNPAWHVGRTWCRPADPRCNECPLSDSCPRLIGRAGAVRGM